ncbi:electron transport complex protein RnfG [uncultured Clostridium sp.]|nr:electron transport complex protein RnfG [uncultured Clostridium sp.]
MRDIWKLAWRLLAITLVAALALGVTNYVTKDPIAQQDREKNDKARQAVFEECDRFEQVDVDEAMAGAQIETLKPLEIYAAYKGDEQMGYTFKIAPKGYGGEIELTVGISFEGKVTGLTVGSNSETAGLGANATKEEFRNLFVDKDQFPLEVSKSASGDNEIQALTGATITSKAVATGVNDAMSFYQQFLSKERK